MLLFIGIFLTLLNIFAVIFFSHRKKSKKDALKQLHKNPLDQSTLLWVDSTLITVSTYGNTYFSFFNTNEQSIFGTHASFYSTPVERSFLLSSLNGSIIRAPFQYSKMLNVLQDIGGNESATWVYGTEPDNAQAIINWIWSSDDAYNKGSENLIHIEQGTHLEGGASYLMLLPKSKKWMLENKYYKDRFTIYLHGHREFIEEVASRININPEWEWQAPEE